MMLEGDMVFDVAGRMFPVYLLIELESPLLFEKSKMKLVCRYGK